MAGDWIKMRGNLWDDPRVARICDLTDATEAAVVGGLYWLWSTADQHTEDGRMPGLTLRQIDRKTGVQGLGAALCEIGWLVDDPQGVIVARFDEHNGASAKRRSMEAQRKANGRKVSAQDADNGGTDGGQDEDEIRRVAELEKRREEKRKNTPKTPKGADDTSSEPEGFVSFWNVWPRTHRKGAREKCLEVWHKHRLERDSAAILAHVAAMALTADWTKEEGQFVPAPVVYLRSKAWSGAELDGLHPAAHAGAI